MYLCTLYYTVYIERCLSLIRWQHKVLHKSVLTDFLLDLFDYEYVKQQLCRGKIRRIASESWPAASTVGGGLYFIQLQQKLLSCMAIRTRTASSSSFI